jgi:hypothetical protein
MNITGGQSAHRKKGFVKNRETCAIALQQGYAWTRQTARTEDKAYSFLSILGFNVHIFYGEV